MENRYLQSEL